MVKLPNPGKISINLVNNIDIYIGNDYLPALVVVANRVVQYTGRIENMIVIDRKYTDISNSQTVHKVRYSNDIQIVQCQLSASKARSKFREAVTIRGFHNVLLELYPNPVLSKINDQGILEYLWVYEEELASEIEANECWPADTIQGVLHAHNSRAISNRKEFYLKKRGGA